MNLVQFLIILQTKIEDQPPVPTPTQRSQSWWPSFLTSSSGIGNTAEETSTEPEADDESPRPWRLWWWFSASPPTAPAPTTVLVKADEPNSAEAALMLLNELVAARDVAQVLTRDRLFCRITCRVDRFRLGLQEEGNQVRSRLVLSAFLRELLISFYFAVSSLTWLLYFIAVYHS